MPVSSTGTLRFFSGDDLLHVGARHLGVDAAQRVVGAELDDDGVGVVADGPGEPARPAAVVSPETPALVDDDVVAARLQLLLQLGRKRMARRSP